MFYNNFHKRGSPLSACVTTCSRRGLTARDYKKSRSEIYRVTTKFNFLRLSKEQEKCLVHHKLYPIMSSIDTSPPSSRIRSASDGEETERPERMRDWLIRMINSNRFPGLEWLDQDKTIFKVPWIHAKKRGYNRERDAALFKEWALHSGKFRDESDPTVWKINFRCAINGLKDIIEMKDYQTEDCRVYKVLPRTRPPKRRRRSIRSGEPYSYPAATAGKLKP